jgi:serine/threonine protein kinase
MTADRWHQVTAIFHAARQRDLASRAAFVAEACRVDPTLRPDVEAMLAGHDEAGAFGQTPFAPVASGLEPGGRTLVTGARLGPYTILAALGAGGMGEVYRARDENLGRDVAIKVLPNVCLSDPERLVRFEREARLLAALNHPHIGAIYGIEEADGVRALVLELVEGETLAARIRRGPVPVRDALTIARQIADALDAAHERGIIHRDLKPANITITPAGVVKVLDFGLAKLESRDGSAPDLTQSPTLTVGGTRDGLILGTAAYMSPEQARGQTVDKRTDIWAFGCVLYEMLTGRAAFGGETITDTLAGILEREPSWETLPPGVPSGVRSLLRRCLQKDGRRRLHDIADARLDIDDLDPPEHDRSRPARMETSWIQKTLVGSLVGLVVVDLSPRSSSIVSSNAIRMCRRLRHLRKPVRFDSSCCRLKI